MTRNYAVSALHRKMAGIAWYVKATQLAGVHRMSFRAYNRSGKGRIPRGRFCNSRHSASSPKAREGDPTARGRLGIFHNNLMAEDGRIELRRVSPRLTAYKAVSAPNGLRLPYQKPVRFEGIGEIKLESGTRFELVYASLQGMCLSNLASRTLVYNVPKSRTGRGERPVPSSNASVSESAERSKTPSIRSRQRRLRDRS